MSSRPKAEKEIMRTALFACLLLVSTVGLAQESPKGIWPIDEVQNARLDSLENEVAKAKASVQSLQEQLTKLKEPVSAPASTPPQKAVAKRDVSRLFNHPPAFLSDRFGQQYNTTDQHLLEHGYTPEEIKGLTPAQKNALHGAAHAGQMAAAPVAAVQYSTAQYSIECNGRRCRKVRRHGGG